MWLPSQLLIADIFNFLAYAILRNTNGAILPSGCKKGMAQKTILKWSRIVWDYLLHPLLLARSAGMLVMVSYAASHSRASGPVIDRA